MDLMTSAVSILHLAFDCLVLPLLAFIRFHFWISHCLLPPSLTSPWYSSSNPFGSFLALQIFPKGCYLTLKIVHSMLKLF